MPKILVIAACLINTGDDRGGVHADEGDITEAPKDTARFLADVGRVLYVDEKDDHTKPARYTASEAMLKAAQAMAKAKSQAAKAAATGSTAEA